MNLPPRAEEILSLPLYPLASPSPPSKWPGRRDTSLCHARTGRASHLSPGLKPLASRSRWTSGSRKENSSGLYICFGSPVTPAFRSRECHTRLFRTFLIAGELPALAVPDEVVGTVSGFDEL